MMNFKKIKEILEKNNIVPNKALGQNFLIDETALERIAELSTEDSLSVLEIGAGLGALTERLAQRTEKIVAVEIDKVLFSILSEIFADKPNVQLIRKDFLKISEDEILSLFNEGSFNIAANLPYYITSPICEKLINPVFPIKRMVLMMQQEAAERFLSLPKAKNYVPLTVLTRQLFDVSTVFSLSPASYYPQPSVNSVVLKFERKDSSMPEFMPKIVRAAFAMRRKTLRNNLSVLIDKSAVDKVITDVDLSPSVRAETLSNEDFIRLSEAYRDYLLNR